MNNPNLLILSKVINLISAFMAPTNVASEYGKLGCHGTFDCIENASFNHTNVQQRCDESDHV